MADPKTPKEQLIEEWEGIQAKCVPDSVAIYTKAYFWVLVCQTVLYFLRRSE